MRGCLSEVAGCEERRAQVEERRGGGIWVGRGLQRDEDRSYKKNKKLNLNLQKTVAGLLDWQSLQFAD